MNMWLTNNRRSYNLEVGNKAEILFHKLMVSRGNKCVKASKDVDIHHHIDFYVNDLGVDVKGNRKMDSIWLELQNVIGNDGWLKGKADYIVFDMVELNSFAFFPRKSLYDHVKDIKEKSTTHRDYMRLHNVKGRKDIIVRTKYSDIKHLQTQIISYSDIKD